MEFFQHLLQVASFSTIPLPHSPRTLTSTARNRGSSCERGSARESSALKYDGSTIQDHVDTECCTSTREIQEEEYRCRTLLIYWKSSNAIVRQETKEQAEERLLYVCSGYSDTIEKVSSSPIGWVAGKSG